MSLILRRMTGNHCHHNDMRMFANAHNIVEMIRVVEVQRGRDDETLSQVPSPAMNYRQIANFVNVHHTLVELIGHNHGWLFHCSIKTDPL